MALDIAGLHQALLRALVPLAPHPGETLEALLARLAAVRLAERDVARLQAQLHGETQFNRKVQINQKLREAQRQLAQLRDPGE